MIFIFTVCRQNRFALSSASDEKVLVYCSWYFPSLFLFAFIVVSHDSIRGLSVGPSVGPSVMLSEKVRSVCYAFARRAETRRRSAKVVYTNLFHIFLNPFIWQGLDTFGDPSFLRFLSSFVLNSEFPNRLRLWPEEEFIILLV